MGKLTIDCGNSSTKSSHWRENCSAPAETITEERGTIDRLAELLDREPVDQAIICSVVDDYGPIVEALRCHGVEPLILSHRSALPIVIDYATPTSLGPDRIAALVGAFDMIAGRETLVVDIGTAITYDRLTADGHFIGGNIAPGIGMRLRALSEFTAHLPKVESRGVTPTWGFSTETAMRAGVIRGVIGEISYYRSLLPDDAALVLTGGWSSDLAEMLPFETIVNRNLVSQGLIRLLIHNENI